MTTEPSERAVTEPRECLFCRTVCTPTADLMGRTWLVCDDEECDLPQHVMQTAFDQQDRLAAVTAERDELLGLLQHRTSMFDGAKAEADAAFRFMSRHVEAMLASEKVRLDFRERGHTIAKLGRRIKRQKDVLREMAKRMKEGIMHDQKGNCGSRAAYQRFEDVCPDHDEPRGECRECPQCPACAVEEAKEPTE